MATTSNSTMVECTSLSCKGKGVFSSSFPVLRPSRVFFTPQRFPFLPDHVVPPLFREARGVAALSTYLVGIH